MKKAFAILSFALSFLLLFPFSAQAYSLNSQKHRNGEIDRDGSKFASGVSDDSLWAAFWELDLMTAEYTPFFRAKSRIQTELLPEGVSEEIWENGIRYELSSSFPANTPSGWGPDGLLSKSEIERLSQPITLGGKTFYNVIERNGYRYFAAFPALYYYKQNNVIEEISIERIEDTADRIVVNVTVTGLGVSVTYPVTYSVVKTGSQNTPKPFAVEWTSSSFALLDAYLTQNGLSPFDVSPQTGDSAVFLLPAAAISLCGILLAAKKRKRTS